MPWRKAEVMVEKPKLGDARTRAIGILTVLCLAGCGDTHATGEPTRQAQLELVNCSLQHDAGLPEPECVPGTTGEQHCTFEVTSDLTLEENCRYWGRLRVTESDIDIDCNNAYLVGDNTTDEKSFGILIESTLFTPPQTPTPPQNIKVFDCTLQNFRVGIGVRNATPDYANSPKNVRLENVHVVGSNATGIHIYQYVEGVLVTKSSVEDSADPGIHLSHHSKKTRVEHSRIYLNGRRAVPHPPTEASGRPREGLTIDGSSENEIVYSEFDANAAGGIFLYSNCGENNGDQRPEATNNLIFRNTFRNSPRGVWVASRQSEDIRRFACDPTPAPSEPHPASPYAFDSNSVPLAADCENPSKADAVQCSWTIEYPGSPDCPCGDAWCFPNLFCEVEDRDGAFFQDFVDETTISKNIFHQLTTYGCSTNLPDDHCIQPDTAVRVEDDNTDILKNAFVGLTGVPLAGDLIRIGTPLRSYHLNDPVHGVVVDGNGYLNMSKATFEARVKYEYGSWAPTNPEPTRTEKACILDGKIVPPHSSDTFYLQRTATVCQAQERNCRNGVLSGSYPYASCTPP